MDIFIGIGPKGLKGNLYDECWSICSHINSKIKLHLKKNLSNYILKRKGKGQEKKMKNIKKFKMKVKNIKQRK